MSLLWSFSHVASSAPLLPPSHRTNVCTRATRHFRFHLRLTFAAIKTIKRIKKNLFMSILTNRWDDFLSFFFLLFSPLSRTIVRWQVIIKQTHIMCDNDWSVAWAEKMDFHVTPTSIHHFDEQWHGFHVFSDLLILPQKFLMWRIF